jgi:hypothetical protein
MAGEGGDTVRSALRVAGRYRPYVAVIVATLLIVLVPSHHSSAGSAGSSAAAAAGRLRTGPASAAPSSGLNGTTAGASTASGLASPADSGLGGAAGGTAAGSSTGGAASGGGALAGTQPAAPTGAGIDSPAALAAPNCDPQRKRIKIVFVYAPPCTVPFPKGASNGGATAPGVTGNSINVVVYNEQGGSAGVGPTEPDSTVYQDWQYADQAFEHFYQLWGRTVHATVVDQTGSDEVSQRADALTIESKHPFAVLSVTGENVPVLTSTLAQHGIIVISDSSVTVKQTLDYPDYVWGDAEPADDTFQYNAADYVAKRLAGRPARWAGDATYQPQPRKFALLYPTVDDPSTFDKEFSRLGGRLADQVSYVAGTGAASGEAEAARTLVTRLKNEGITSIVVQSDFLFLTQLTTAAANDDWFPEWVMTGYGGQDIDLFAKSFNQLEWRHAFGVGALAVYGGAVADSQFFNWYWGANSAQAANANGEIDNFYLGINNAGPDLTPQTFRAGLFASPPAGGASLGQVLNPGESFGRWGFYPWTSYTAWDDWTEVWWDPTAQGEDNLLGKEQLGDYRYVNGGKRYLTPQWPTTEPSMFNQAGTTISYSTPPPADQIPAYPCTGCPGG